MLEWLDAGAARLALPSAAPVSSDQMRAMFRQQQATLLPAAQAYELEWLSSQVPMPLPSAPSVPMPLQVRSCASTQAPHLRSLPVDALPAASEALRLPRPASGHACAGVQGAQWQPVSEQLASAGPCNRLQAPRAFRALRATKLPPHVRRSASSATAACA